MLDGKWRHMMDQTHLGYVIWQQPVRNAMTAVTEVQVPARGELGLAVEGDPDARSGDFPINDEVINLPALSPFGPPARWVELFNRGRAPVRFILETSVPWLKLSATAGELGADQRIEVSVDWSVAPAGLIEGKITVRSDALAKPLVVTVPVDHRPVSGRVFVETDGHVAIEAPHFARAIPAAGIEWKTLADFGPTVGGVTSFPVTAGGSKLNLDGARLEYDVFFHSVGDFAVEVQCAPSWDFQPAKPLEFAISLDDQPLQRVKLGLTATNRDWERTVADSVRRVSAHLRVGQPGAHVLKVWRVTPGVVLERIVINTGGVRPSYLGPPESGRAQP